MASVRSSIGPAICHRKAVAVVVEACVAAWCDEISGDESTTTGTHCDQGNSGRGHEQGPATETLRGSDFFHLEFPGLSSATTAMTMPR
jgi:hypothetical protein